MIKIDGSRGEGGGQLLRSALAFSALTGQAFTAVKIRANRRKPGLRPQHLAAVRLAAQLCGAHLEGDRTDSGTLMFRPAELRPGHFRQEIGTAGSLVLLTQACLVPALRAGGPVVLEILGGTDVPMAPPLDYLSEIVLPYYRRLGRIEVEVDRRGFNPKAGGIVRFHISGSDTMTIAPLDLTGPSQWAQARGRALASDDLKATQVAKRMSQAACRESLGRAPVETYVAADSSGAVLTLWCQDESGQRWSGTSTLGAQGTRAEMVGLQTAANMRRILGDSRPADEHLADQLIPLLAVVGGRMECQTISQHCATNIEICQRFSGTRFAVEGSTIEAELAGGT